MELYEASVQEYKARVSDGKIPAPIESHPDGHKGEPADGMDHMYGR
jgi:hypothetical protein